MVRQYHYTGWPDVGSPESGSGLIDLIGQVQKWQQNSGNTAITVHCRYAQVSAALLNLSQGLPRFQNGGRSNPGRLVLVSTSQNDVGHLIRFIQCSILYGYITDVHENRTAFIKRRTKRIEIQLSKG